MMKSHCSSIKGSLHSQASSAAVVGQKLRRGGSRKEPWKQPLAALKRKLQQNHSHDPSLRSPACKTVLVSVDVSPTTLSPSVSLHKRAKHFAHQSEWSVLSRKGRRDMRGMVPVQHWPSSPPRGGLENNLKQAIPSIDCSFCIPSEYY